MKKSLFLIFNHKLTPDQENDARASLSAERIAEMPSELGDLWGQIPSDLPELGDYLDPIKNWLASEAAKDDYVLVQGDFGACFIMVSFAFEKELVPVYATTKRKSVEERGADGSVKTTRRFKHQIFRKYGV